MDAGPEPIASPSAIPSPAEFQELLSQLTRQRQEAESRLLELADENKHLRQRIDYLLRKLFGKSSEKIDPAQLELGLAHGTSAAEAAAVEQAAAAVSPAPGPERKGHGRGRLPAKLPRVEVVYELPPGQTCCQKCREQMEVIAEEVSEELDFVPAQLIVRRKIRKKYACPRCPDVLVTAPAPPAPIDKGLAGPGLLAQVAVAKFSDHTPLYRMARIFARSGVEIDRNTLGDWVAAVADLLDPVVEEMKRQLLGTGLLQSDDTPVTVLDGKNPSWTGRIWVYGPPEGEVVFEFTEDRAGVGPLRFLQGFRGVLQADAYSGYDVVFRTLPVKEAGCWAHARRKVYDAHKFDPARAGPLLQGIGALFEVERQAKALSPEARRALRQEKSRPVLDSIDALTRALQAELLPKEPLAGAVGYIRNQWAALTLFLDDGRLPIHTNAAERTLRGVAVGRKNWMFLGSVNGGRRAAVMFSLVESCKRLCIDPFAYLRDVLQRVPTHPASKVAQLTPAGWKLAFPDLAAQAAIPASL